MVLPSADLEIWRDRLAAGWQVVGRGGATWRESTEGDGALAIELDLPATSSLSAFWTLDWQPPAALGRRGFAYLRFEIHPGNTRADKAPHMAFMINSTTVNLEDQVDLGSARWQRVEIPLDELGREDAIERLRFWGRSTGTFYLRERAFIVAAELRSTLVHAPVVPPVGALLAPNSPNPFNGSTEIHYAVPIAQAVELSIYNLAGQRVAVLVEGVRRAGAYSVRWDGRGSDGRAQASGVYLYRLRMARGREETRKLLLLR
jgi:hypothetical protein